MLSNGKISFSFGTMTKFFPRSMPFVCVVRSLREADSTIYTSTVSKEKRQIRCFAADFLHLDRIDFLTFVVAPAPAADDVDVLVFRRVFILNDIHPIKSLLKKYCAFRFVYI